MPNENWSKLAVYGPKDALARFRQRARRGSGKKRVPFDLDQLRPPPDDPRGARLVKRLGEMYWDPKGNCWDAYVGRVRTTPDGVSCLEYSFMTPWCEPIGPVAFASLDFPELCFVLAGVEVGNAGFTSTLIHRGRVRHWEMPEKVWEKHAEIEEFESQNYLAGCQPEIMRALLDHWEPTVRRLLASGQRRSSRAEQ